MSEYTLSPIFPSDRRAMRQLDQLLEKEGIQRDGHLDYTAGLFDGDYRLVATGSCFGNTLRCMAVDSACQGEGLLNQIVTHLMEYEYERGILDLFLYTKCSTALFFKSLGFYEIARVPDRVVFMENRKTGFASYLEDLKKETEAQLNTAPESLSGRAVQGAVVINANPFTLGHRYLIEEARKRCGLLHIFVVSEDVSLIPYKVRRRLVEEGCRGISGLVFHETKSYMISSSTFPSYFFKDEDTVIRSHGELDIAVFVQIAEALEICCRFAGEEPFSRVTRLYNQVMEEKLPQAGLDFIQIPRKETDGSPISASHVRKLIQEGNTDRIRPLVPESTWKYFASEEGAETVKRIREAEEVIHY
ncbi:MAG TPA: [citrate (pro-3S)-lyase] ligase [Candidatus Lachnoclostridium stercorigallinarum]|uniref:[Citrate [pro-3S]-lyase] ligase n=1 Tax=Candidatus Lachnoclostridium stercorigallinarum TaxID=2838634 RepID=A0A9D2GGY5_9FIRM|nr:[citrate (pro-3S)-lyase] ligase [Candidatus Lachnoclostridium stercorigallinarum]